jgi:hypothetical protein
MANKLSVCTYNMHGFNQGSNLLSNLCAELEFNTDVILLQEHWLTPDNMYKVINFGNRYLCFGMSAMEQAVSRSILYGRPYGGVCILIKSSLANMITYHKCDERYAIVALSLFIESVH